MKHCYLLFLILIIFLNCSLVKAVVIPDQNLAAAVRAAPRFKSKRTYFRKRFESIKTPGVRI